MEQTEAQSAARDGYDRMAQEYVALVGEEFEKRSLTRSMLELFAHEVAGTGRVADVGCGPGHLTALLADLGVDIFGIDISPTMVDHATATHPGLHFEIGTLAALPIDTGALSAVVSRHSLIHTPPDLIPGALDEFVRVLQPGGRLFLSFFAAATADTHGEPFDHAVTTAWQLDTDTISAALNSACLSETVRIIRQPHPTERQLPTTILLATRA